MAKTKKKHSKKAMAKKLKRPTKQAVSDVSASKVTEPPAAVPAKEDKPAAEVFPSTTRGRASWFKTWAHHLGRFGIYSSVPEIALAASLLLARYLQNSDFSYPQEIVLPIVLFAVIGTVVYYLYKLILRDILGSHAAALTLVYALYAYNYSFPSLHNLATKVTPHSMATTFTSTVICLVVLVVVFGLGGFVLKQLVKHVRHLQALQLHKILVFAVCFILAIQVVKVGSRIWAIRHQLSYHYTAPTLTQDKSRITGKPNVYYIVLDRYASNTTLAKDYNYDNSGFTNYLTDQGFTTRADAYANYPFTMQSITSTLAMSYHTNFNKLFAGDGGNFQTAFPYRQIFDNPPAAQAFKQNGYTYNQVSSWWDFTRDNIQADTQPTKDFRLRIFGMQFWLTDLQRDIVNKSIIWPLLTKGLTVGHTTIAKYDLDTPPRQNFEQQIAALTAIATNSATQKTPQFTFAHILVPHDPYIYEADGSMPDYDGDRDDGGVDEGVKYTNQLTYLNTRVENLVSIIRTKDPNAAIVIQSDEGPYPKQFRGTLTQSHYYNPINLPLQQMQQKFGVFSSYYLPNGNGDKIDSSVNALRVILKDYLGYNAPNLPDCQFTSGDKYVLYDYQLVTGRLKNAPQPTECNQYK